MADTAAEVINFATGQRFGGFIPGVSRPFYEQSDDFSGNKNVGAFGQMTPYAGTITNGIATLSTANAVYENVLFPCVIDIRANVSLINCMQIVPKTHTYPSSIKACIQILNGAQNNVVIEDMEIHNRAQRPFNGIAGRNFTMRRTVITGTIDGWSDSAAGGSPQVYGYVVEDCIMPATAIWYSSTINPDVHGSTPHSHSDVFQKYTELQGTVKRSVLLSYADEYIGTGTPGSGSETNPYVPPSGYNFIRPQAEMEALRDQQINKWTTPSQTYTGKSQRMSAGSMAVLMLNRGQLDLDDCILDGGSVAVNAVDLNSGSPITCRLTNNQFWNAMTNGPGSRTTNPLVKGNSILTTNQRSFELLTGNAWFDGNPLTRVEEGSYSIWRGATGVA